VRSLSGQISDLAWDDIAASPDGIRRRMPGMTSRAFKSNGPPEAETRGALGRLLLVISAGTARLRTVAGKELYIAREMLECSARPADRRINGRAVTSPIRSPAAEWDSFIDARIPKLLHHFWFSGP
jgi:hypothetical protein